MDDLLDEEMELIELAMYEAEEILDQEDGVEDPEEELSDDTEDDLTDSESEFEDDSDDTWDAEVENLDHEISQDILLWTD